MKKKFNNQETRNYSELLLDAQAPVVPESSPCKCNKEFSDCWNRNSCYLVPDFGIDSKGELEHLACGFIFWVIQSGWPIPQGPELKIANNNSIYPQSMQYAISNTTPDGIQNLIKRYESYLEKVRNDIVN